ncbi:hypothetical protein KEM54_002152 [Ascosphaera aggregata]|nr:hypothetical protein KEM54_002152 [Ascosphaera aggregata]
MAPGNAAEGLVGKPLLGSYFKDYFNQPTRAEIGTMVAILEVGAFISSLCVGKIGDMIGRRRTILHGSIIFFVGGLLQTCATGIPMMLLGRIVAGLGVGALSTIVPVYQSEISPPHNRGKLACIEFTGNISGYAASVWLLDNDHDEEGMTVIANLYGGGDIHNAKARQEYRDIKMGVLLQRQERERSYSDMFKRYSKRVLIAMSAQAMAQLNGINVISYYAPLVFESAGWVGRDAILMTGINAISYLVSTVPPWYVVDRWGRRPILLWGAIAMIISLSLMSYFIYLNIAITPLMTVIFVMVYNFAFGASWGPIPWLYPPEILPLSIRAKGASLSTAANWAFNWLVGEVTPVLQAAIKWRLYLMHAFFCACSFVLVYFTYPETSGVRLEDMDILFGDATTAMPTPATVAERGPLIPSGSPASSIAGRRIPIPGRFGSDAAIPGLDINPPSVGSPSRLSFVQNARGRSGSFGSRRYDDAGGTGAEGLGGWISNMIRGDGKKKRSNDRYSKLGQEEDGMSGV